jgi:diguanylate cyclase (GGDEF)-like protein/PAS domain S-box-containing protein
VERERKTQLDRIDLGVASVLQRASLALYTIFALIVLGTGEALLLDLPETAQNMILLGATAALIALALVLRQSLRQVERDQRAAQERTESFFGLSLDMLCTIDQANRLAELNPSWTRVLGWSLDELRARPAIEFVHPDDRQRTIELSEIALTPGKEGTVLENRWQTYDGDWRWLSWSLRTGNDDVKLYGRATDVTERKQIEEELHFLARHDQLTGLANRRKFEEDLGRHLARTRRYGWRGALISVDLDGLKSVNDTRGHAAGDALLRLAAQRMSRVLRTSDLLARLGGDEFAILLPEADPLNARAVAEKIARALAEPEPDGTAPVASIGVATIEEQIGAEELFARADRALYAAKRASGGTFRLAPERAAGPAPSRSGEQRARTPQALI